MYNQDNVPGPEVRIRPVVRYLVTTFYHPYTHAVEGGEPIPVSGGSKVVCECENERQAEDVLRALKHLHDSDSQAMKDAKPPQ